MRHLFEGYTHGRPLGQKRLHCNHPDSLMSRFSFILLSVVIIVVVALVALSFVNTERPPVTVEKAMLNEAQAK
ncbi:hypothetical protein ASE00_04995 [Sphingomonas sp. Root710]|nr:hypothetical protein ASE00_04995 [Sphingomonas sp. Root710]